MIKQLPILNRAASFAPDTVNTESRTVNVIWSTGATVRRGGMFSEPYNEALSMAPECVRMERLQSGNAPLLWTHDLFAPPLGIVENASLSDGIGSATVRFSKRADVEPIWQDVQDGIIRNVSVGLIIHRARETSKPGDALRTVEITDWEPREISLASVGLDAGAVIRSAGETSSCEFDSHEEGPAPKPGPVAVLRLALEIEKEIAL